MATEEKRTISPPPDVELGFKRNELEYFLTFPAQGVNPDTGLILVIPGFGARADSEYQKNKLRPYLADKYNCIAAGINYFGIKLRAVENALLQHQIPDVPRFANAMEAMFGIPFALYSPGGMLRLDILTDLLKQKGIKRLGYEFTLCRKIMGMEPEYESFGFLPALDHLAVLGEILKNYEIDKRKIIAFGSSYGGYIALLLGKYAPNTFAMIIDNSGFATVKAADVATLEMSSIYGYLTINGVEFPQVIFNPWTLSDETSPFYFSDSRRYIRSLLREDHIMNSETKYCVFHSAADKLVPVEQKGRYVDILKTKSIDVYYRKVYQRDIDGKLFKNMDHGMDASLRGIFDLAAELQTASFSKKSPHNDFDLESERIFNCCEMSYSFKFSRQSEVSVRIIRN